MKKMLFPLALLMLSSSVFAERYYGTVHSFDQGKKGEDHLLFLNSGRVIIVKKNGRFSFSRLDFRPGVNIAVDVDENNELEAISSMPDESMPSEEEPMPTEVMPDATVLPDFSTASKIFSGMNRSWKSNTECTDRAHVWTYEEWKKYGLISRKVFMFFTNTYIRRYNYHWWFHVSPYVLVQSGEGVVERVLDRRYTSGIRTMKSWSDIFIASKKSCPVTTYAYYRANKNSPEHCFHVKSNMYNRLPLHVRNQENTGRVQTRFNTSEVNFSYRAFTRRGAK
ncbi:protein-glutamine glutaminase family protein [Peredibacter starrii]|uniref:Protein-glutamine glutaminase family protein n=1 Tax=Peredibacter starrii TaxID=28202 RepID=A0AAX4HU45_9BACT|nr:protein-glutamine glutaminase family protein [Peredibacter starrii]WPU66757.1 protein-glutamine glutaminase family protein [Peredibacter starrii]